LFTFVIQIFNIMKERIQEFLKAENKSSAQFAEEIGVQPSGISHILSGRNNPSLDFVLKMLEKYPFLSTDWLLFGKGIMYKDSRMQTLFEENYHVKSNEEIDQVDSEVLNTSKGLSNTEINNSGKIESKQGPGEVSALNRIVWFYEDNSFEEYFPRK